jgi:acyl-CoA reductase-like NAD-dependent aldehyde dehydrogenase
MKHKARRRWNFPALMLTLKLASALATGNAMVVKVCRQLLQAACLELGFWTTCTGSRRMLLPSSCSNVVDTFHYCSFPDCLATTWCTCLFQVAEQTPLTAARYGELALEAGVPFGVLNIIQGVALICLQLFPEHVCVGSRRLGLSTCKALS